MRDTASDLGDRAVSSAGASVRADRIQEATSRNGSWTTGPSRPDLPAVRSAAGRNRPRPATRWRGPPPADHHARGCRAHLSAVSAARTSASSSAPSARRSSARFAAQDSVRGDRRRAGGRPRPRVLAEDAGLGSCQAERGHVAGEIDRRPSVRRNDRGSAPVQPGLRGLIELERLLGISGSPAQQREVPLAGIVVGVLGAVDAGIDLRRTSGQFERLSESDRSPVGDWKG